jgi:hypothetical protein
VRLSTQDGTHPPNGGAPNEHDDGLHPKQRAIAAIAGDLNQKHRRYSLVKRIGADQTDRGAGPALDVATHGYQHSSSDERSVFD